MAMASFWTSWHVGLGLVGLAVGVLVGSGRLDRLPRMRWDPMGTAAAAAIAVMVVSGALRWWWLVGLALAALPAAAVAVYAIAGAVEPSADVITVITAFGLVLGTAVLGWVALVMPKASPASQRGVRSCKTRRPSQR